MNSGARAFKLISPEEYLSKENEGTWRHEFVKISNNEDIRYYYPDVFVSCDPNDRAKHWREHPVLIIEVLSSATERYDRAEKFEAYKSIPSLLEYGLLSQDQIELELFRRRTNWQREVFVHDNTVQLESLGITIMVSRMYARSDLVE